MANVWFGWLRTKSLAVLLAVYNFFSQWSSRDSGQTISQSPSSRKLTRSSPRVLTRLWRIGRRPGRRAVSPGVAKRFTLILDLDETLVHSSLRYCGVYDMKLEVFIEKQACLFFVYKRPHVDFFLRTVDFQLSVLGISRANLVLGP